MLMWFYVGDKGRIGNGFSPTATVPLWQQPFVVAMVDFSLNLSPIDLDFLFQEACLIAAIPPVTLTDSLIENVGGNGQTHSADVVSPQMVETIAYIPGDQVEELAKRWAAQIAIEYNEQQAIPNEEIRVYWKCREKGV